MKKKISFIFAILFVVASSFLLVGCFNFKKDPPEHTHTYETTYSYDDTYHWLEATCGCDEIKDKDTHSFTVGVCVRCGYRKPVQLSYSFVDSQGGYYRVTGITGGKGIKNVVIPDTYEGYPVKAVSGNAFSNKGVETVVLGANIENIGSSAFRSNPNLTSVTFNDKLTYIGDSCFKDCTSLETIVLPDGINSINQEAFANTAVKEITIPANVEYLKNCFYDCKQLTSVTFNGPPTTFYGTFENCTALETIVLPDNLTYIGLDTFAGCTNLKNITIPASVKNIHARAFLNCSSNLKVNFKGTLNDYAKIEFNEYSSNPLHCGAQLLINGNVVKSIDNTVTTISEYAFYNYDTLENFQSGDGMLEISKMAFYDCDNLTTVTLPNTLTAIGESAFYDCDNLETINISSSVETIGIYAFNSLNNLKQFVVDAQNQNFASLDGSLYSKDMTVMYQYPLGKESTTFDLPDTVTEIKKSAFEEAVFDQMTLNFVGATLNGTENTYFGYIFGAEKYEDNSLFVPEQLKTITINGACTLNSYCFYGLNNLTTVNLENVTKTESEIFSGCDGITSLYFPSSITGQNFSSSTLSGLNNLQTLSVYQLGDRGHIYPETLKSLTIRGNEKIYTNSVYGARNVEQVILPQNLLQIEYDAFLNFVNLKEIDIPESVTYIGPCAFENCTSLTEFTFPKNVTSINGSVLNGCRTLETVNVLGDVTFIGYKAFYYCYNLKNINFKDVSKINTIYEFAFAHTDISQLHLTKNTTTIERGAFSGCSIDDLTLPFIGENINTVPEYDYDEGCYLTGDYVPVSVNNLTILGGKIEDRLFEQCLNSIKTLTLGDDITYIGAYAFSGCYDLETVNFGNLKSQSIRISAFNGCEKLTKVNVESLESWFGLYFDSQFSNPLYYAKNFYINNVLAETIIIPDQITKINGYTFYNCLSLKKLYLHENFQTFGRYALTGCDNLQFTTDGNLTYFGTPENEYYAVYKPISTDITSFAFNKDAKIIMSGAFDDCENISEVDVSTVEQWCNLNCTSNTPLVSNSTLKINGENTNSIVIPSTITSVNNYTFRNITSFTDVTIEEGVKEIGENAFQNCKNLKNIKLPSTIETLKKSCFVGCDAIEKVDVPNVVDWLEITFEDYDANPLENLESAYLYVNNVKADEIIVPETVKIIKQNTFAYVKTLSKITFTNKTTSFLKDAFIECPVDVYISDIDSWAGNLFKNITSNPVNISGNLYLNNVLLENLVITSQTLISAYAFANCKNLKTFTSEVNLVSIGDYAFYKCSNLTTVDFQVIDYIYDENIPKTSVGSYAFADCKSMNEFYCGYMTSIGKYAFLNCNNFILDTTKFVLSNTIRYNGYWRLYDGIYFYDDIREMYSNKAVATLLVKTYVDKDWKWEFED